MNCNSKIDLSDLHVPAGNNGGEYNLNPNCIQPSTITTVVSSVSSDLYLFSTENNFFLQTENGFRVNGVVGLTLQPSMTMTGSFSALASEDDESFQMENGTETIVNEYLVQ